MYMENHVAAWPHKHTWYALSVPIIPPGVLFRLLVPCSNIHREPYCSPTAKHTWYALSASMESLFPLLLLMLIPSCSAYPMAFQVVTVRTTYLAQYIRDDNLFQFTPIPWLKVVLKCRPHLLLNPRLTLNQLPSQIKQHVAMQATLLGLLQVRFLVLSETSFSTLTNSDLL